MYFIKRNGESHVQLTIRIPRRWGIVLNQMRKAGKHSSLNSLVYSILAEIVNDELDQAKPNGSQRASVSVASP